MNNFWRFVFTVACVLCSQPRSVAGELMDLDTVRKGWNAIQDELASTSGLFHFSVHYTNAKSPPDQSFHFRINGTLAKRIEPSDTTNEEIVWLWAREGSYLLRKPPGEKWMIVKRNRMGDWQGESPITACSRSINILSAPLLFLTSSNEFDITKLELDDDDTVLLEIAYKGKFSQVDRKKFDPNSGELPTFDRVSIRLDPDYNFRVRNYRLTRTLSSGQTERVKVENSYGNSQTPFLPSISELVYLAADEKQIITKLLTTFSETTRERVPEHEFTLEHYGLSTPDSVTFSWRTWTSLILGAVVFVGLAIRFFQRQNE